MMRNEQKKERDDDPALVQLVRRVEHELELNDGSAVQVVKQIQMDEEFSFLLDAYRPDYYYWECVVSLTTVMASVHADVCDKLEQPRSSM
eukprot:SAG31_NODE_117_length_24022_cov_6.878067_13_plen_90_part_00